MMEQDSSGWAKANSPDHAPNRSRSAGRSAPAKRPQPRAIRSEVEPGRWTVILEPAAVLDLVGFLFYDFAGTAILDQRSCFNKRMGKKVMGENITIHDDVTHPLQSGPPFDGEGMPRQKVLLVDSGVPRNLVYARATAKKMKAKPTGHGLPLAQRRMAKRPSIWSSTAAIRPLDDNGRLHRSRHPAHAPLVHPRSRSLRKSSHRHDPRRQLPGRKRHASSAGIRNFRFNQSILEMLSNVEQMSPAVRAAGEESFEMVVPAMKVRDFHFTEVTKF